MSIAFQFFFLPNFEKYCMSPMSCRELVTLQYQNPIQLVHNKPTLVSLSFIKQKTLCQMQNSKVYPNGYLKSHYLQIYPQLMLLSFWQHIFLKGRNHLRIALLLNFLYAMTHHQSSAQTHILVSLAAS